MDTQLHHRRDRSVTQPVESQRRIKPRLHNCWCEGALTEAPPENPTSRPHENESLGIAHDARAMDGQVLRYFILLLSMRCRELFGKWLPGTVATAAGVVFSKKIAAHQVRDMVRAHDPDGTSP